MTFDQVHDTQGAFRQLLKAFKNPGTIIDFKGYLETLQDEFKTLEYIFGSIFLDQEVTYFSDQKRLPFEDIFYTKSSQLRDADLVFLSYNNLNKETFLTVKYGTFEDPHKSALLLIEVNQISNDKAYSLKGPGIKNTAYVSLHDQNDIIDIYIENKLEYPLGIDIIFYTKNQFFAITRTTQFSKEY